MPKTLFSPWRGKHFYLTVWKIAFGKHLREEKCVESDERLKSDGKLAKFADKRLHHLPGWILGQLHLKYPRSRPSGRLGPSLPLLITVEDGGGGAQRQQDGRNGIEMHARHKSCVHRVIEVDKWPAWSSSKRLSAVQCEGEIYPGRYQTLGLHLSLFNFTIDDNISYEWSFILRGTFIRTKYVIISIRLGHPYDNLNLQITSNNTTKWWNK